MNHKEKSLLSQELADHATVGIINDSKALLAVEPEYVNTNWLREAMKDLELICERAERAQVVRMHQTMEEVRHVYHF